MAQTASAKKKINKYLTIDEDGSTVITKVNCTIEINLEEYKNISEDYGEAVGVEELNSVFKIPGFFRIYFNDDMDTLDFFFPYSVYLNKTEDNKVNSKLIKIEYEPGDTVFYAKYKEMNTNIKVLDSLFENGAKYLASKPEQLVMSIWNQLLPTSNIPMHHIELMVSQLYGSYDKTTGEFKPTRLTDDKYSKENMMNTKVATQNTYNSLGFLYGYTNDALRTSMVKKKNKENSFFEDLIGGNYDKMIEDSKKSEEK